MKWVIHTDYDYDYEKGTRKITWIGFKAVYPGDIEYTCAYDTKDEALSAFCRGTVMIESLTQKPAAEDKEPEEEQPKCDVDSTNLSCHLDGMCYEHGKIQLDHEQRIKKLEEFIEELIKSLEIIRKGRTS